ncbi:DUF6509 family protein [Paenibacillus sp. YN15]|uniref:DUF6509 family protein n=1 Tax=Paenibacillus sp. YN15 TaxID=1742774 RepID=UPI000DCBF271|nr:DUF6509 family protein [Paenibacillus sp. YN15]RAV04752.1 pullulanase [Paenibacillus sp. YN15]
MLEITSYTVEWIRDPFGIIQGKRYEFLLDIQVEEDDEIYSPHGLTLRVIYLADGEASKIVKYEFLEKGTGKYLDFDMVDEEYAEALAFCQAHYAEAEED